MTNAQTLANEMNVSLADLMCLAGSVANSIKQDDVALDQVSTEVVTAYIPHAVKKFDTFATKYLTNPDARETFQRKVLSEVIA